MTATTEEESMRPRRQTLAEHAAQSGRETAEHVRDAATEAAEHALDRTRETAVHTRDRASAHKRAIALVLAVAGAVAAAIVVLRDSRRRGRLRGAAAHAVAKVKPTPDYDDVTLARKVETEIFRPADAPKGHVDVNAVDGVVELRGEVKHPEDIVALGSAAAKVSGVREVHNLLHTAGSPPKHSPISTPDEVRARAARHH